MMVFLELQLPHVIFEGDCLQVIVAANRDKPLETELFSIIYDIQILMK